MGVYYWDYRDYATTTTSTCAASGTYKVYRTATTATTSGEYFYAPPRREIIVQHPEAWTDEQHAKYVQMVNDKINVGWRVKMLMKGGDILIADPNIEIRSMKDFVPLLKDRASAEDRAVIDAFFKENPA